MRNIGPVSRQWLAEIEIFTIDDVRQVGAVAAYMQVKARYPDKVTTNLLWALLGAEQEVDWRTIAPEVKERALAEVNGSVGGK
jgi:DNA transformation protein